MICAGGISSIRTCWRRWLRCRASGYDQAYFDGPLPIGSGQTISQPYIVALMTQELRLSPDCRVLEIGTGSGYQTAVLARLATRVYTIERMQDLSAAAQDVLAKVGVDNVEFRVGETSPSPFSPSSTKPAASSPPSATAPSNSSSSEKNTAAS